MLDALRDFGKLLGFHQVVKHNNIQCNRYGKKEYSHSYQSGQLKRECTFNLNIKVYYNPKLGSKTNIANRQETKQMKAIACPDWTNLTSIVSEDSGNRSCSTCYHHGGGCLPSPHNLLVANEHSGGYQCKLDSLTMYQLCRMVEGKRLSSNSIKSILKPIWPRKKDIRPQDVHYIWKKVNNLVPVLHLNPSYENFKVASNDSDFLGGIDDEIEIDDDTANEIARELWLEILTDSNGDSSWIVTFLQYMNLLQSQTTGFIYEFATDSYGKVNGLVWQTTTMRSNFERYGGYISLDTMKWEINKWLWPYMSIVMYNEHKIMCLGYEGIMCGERVDRYKFMCNFLIRNTPGHDPDKVHVFSGDGFFDQAMVHDLGFRNARYLKDWSHLFFIGLTDKFGQYGAELLEDELKQMIRARNQEYFIQAKMNATTKLHQISPRNMLLEKKLEEFAHANHDHEYSQFQIDTMKGS